MNRSRVTDTTVKAVFESFVLGTLINSWFHSYRKRQNFTEILPRSMGIAYKLLGRKAGCLWLLHF